jgi:hypothetical protein
MKGSRLGRWERTTVLGQMVIPRNVDTSYPQSIIDKLRLLTPNPDWFNLNNCEKQNEMKTIT